MTPKKSRKADLEKKRAIHTQVGLTIALSLLLISLEWSTVVPADSGMNYSLDGPVFEPGLPELIKREKRNEEKLPVIATPIPVPEDEVDPDDILEGVVFTAGEDPSDISLIVGNLAKGEEDEKQVYEPFEVDLKAEFPGGEAAMLKWLANNVKYPRLSSEHGVYGRVTARFTVSKTGKVTNIVILKGVHPDLDRAVVDALERMPDFSPAIVKGRPVPVNMVLPVVFRLQ